MSDTPNYTIWRPEYDGHAPPYWREWMKWNCNGVRHKPMALGYPVWSAAHAYEVPVEALTAPNEDDAAFDVAVWLEQGRANLDKLPEGVVLPEPKDWATELWADLKRTEWSFAVDDPNGGRTITQSEREAADRATIALIRERVVLKGEG